MLAFLLPDLGAGNQFATADLQFRLHEKFGEADITYNAAIWSAIQNIAAMAHQLDPNHPTLTTVAEIGGEKVQHIHALCPAIDIVGINTYAGTASIPQRYRKAAPHRDAKPYMITEFGPAGVWEVRMNDLGAVDEPNSTDMVEWYRKAYQDFAGDTSHCLGSYAFAWGSKQEATATWFGLFLPDGAKTPAVDALAELWSGKPPANLAPAIKSLKLNQNDGLRPGDTIKATLDATDAQGDTLKVTWVLYQDSKNYHTGGDAQAAPPSYPDAFVTSDAGSAEVKLPDSGGLYRLYAFVEDGQGGGTVANAPLRVQGPQAEAPRTPAHEAKLPFALVADRIKPPYIASGWMGDTAAISMDEACIDKPHGGKTCVRFTYAKGDGWGGVIWQNPANDWGDQPGGYDLSGAKQLSFWARGEQGGEKIKFGFGAIGRDKEYFDTGKGEVEVTLSDQWKQYSIDVTNKDLSRIKSGFMWTLGGQGRPITF